MREAGNNPRDPIDEPQGEGLQQKRLEDASPLNADFRSGKFINILRWDFPLVLGKSGNLPLPRLKAIHSKRLYRSEAGQPDAYPNLQPVLSKPINWELIRQQ
jgi:hypothetical protein